VKITIGLIACVFAVGVIAAGAREEWVNAALIFIIGAFVTAGAYLGAR
jgi:hypothetical protein